MSEFGFNESYRGTPPWDIGRPQPAFVRLAEQREIEGRVLDVGCGTGEHVLYFASLGLTAKGLDAAPRAISKARKKAAARRLEADFIIGDALHLEKFGEQFDVITDCGLFHTFSDEDRIIYQKSLRSALEKGGTYFMLCFSTKEPTDWGGPRRVSESEIRGTFDRGWKVNYVKEARISTNFNEEGGYGWLSSITSK